MRILLTEYGQTALKCIMDKLPERITYIDDDQDLRSLVRDAVEDQEFPGAFGICGSGDEFFKRVRVLQPQLILLDLRMPEMNGADVIEMMQRVPETEGLPVIFLTGVADIEMIKSYEKLGVIGVIHKPFNVDTFLQDVQKIWVEYGPAEREGEADSDSQQD